MKYKPVIGLEVHVELKTKTKMFCDSLNDPDEKHPNINVCPICLAHPGTLPVINYEAVKKVIMAGLALNCKIAEDTFFERKNYFYPDLPKGYQISQYQKPLCQNGVLEITNHKSQITNNDQNPNSKKKIRITRIHLEEDAGRLYHLSDKGYSLVDYNRAGMPLMELVTEPDFETGQEVKKFAEELQLILRYLGVSDADMEKGQMRVEVNISLTGDDDPPSPEGFGRVKKLGTKVEIKNLNSIKAASDSVDYEIKRQTEILEAGEKVVQETRGWDDSKKVTISQRSKEEAHDYRYFPEPDLPPLKFTPAQIEEIRLGLSELPSQRRERFKKIYNLPDADVEVFTTNKSLGNYFEHVASELLSFDKFSHLEKPSESEYPKLLKLAANYLITNFSRMIESVSAEPEDTKVTSEMFARLIIFIFHAQISSTVAAEVLADMFQTGEPPEKIIETKGLTQISDTSELQQLVDKVIANNSQAVEDYKKGKEASLKFLVGMVMRESGGRANPTIVQKILEEKLKL